MYYVHPLAALALNPLLLLVALCLHLIGADLNSWSWEQKRNTMHAIQTHYTAQHVALRHKGVLFRQLQQHILSFRDAQPAVTDSPA